MPRPLSRPAVGLAAALTAGLLATPGWALADPGTADPTPDPSGSVSASPTPAAGSSRSAESSLSAGSSPSTGSSTAADPAADGAPEATETPSASTGPSADAEPDPTESAEPDQTETAEPDPTETAQPDAAAGGGDAVQAPAPDAAQEEPGRVEAQAVPPAGISLTKSASPTRVSRVGQVITYRFVATNNGAIPLTDVSVTDELEGLEDLTCDRGAPATLAVRQAVTCTASLTVTQAVLDFGDIDNVATVFGSFVIEGEGDTPDIEDYVGATASTTVRVVQRPSVSLDAAVSPTGRADAGDRLRYTATATNTGNVTLTAARITSSLDALDLDCEPSARARLAPGDSISCAGSYRVTAADARRGRVSNELTARAERPYGQSTRSDDVTDEVRLRVAVTRPPATSTDSGLADTGGPGDALPVGLAGLVSLAAGTALLRRRRP